MTRTSGLLPFAMIPTSEDIRCHAARTSDPATSRDAADAVAPKLARRQAMVLSVFARAGGKGATNEDIYAAYPNEREDSLRPRVAELVARGLLVGCGTRPGSRGCDVSVWHPTALGYAAAESYMEVT